MVWLKRIKISRVVGSIVVMVGVMCALVLGTYSLRGQMQRILDQVPEEVSNLSTGMGSTPKRAATRVVVDPPGFKHGNFLLVDSMGVALRSIGLENAGAWSVAAGLLHVIPPVQPGRFAAVAGRDTFPTLTDRAR